MRDSLGIEVPDDRRGVLQDVHWAAGLIGYFPTYTLGNLYAAQFFHAAREALPHLDRDLARGRTGSLRAWLHHTSLPVVEAALTNPAAAPDFNPLDPEPRPLDHLREYSNYLTPRVGLFSADT